MSQATHVYRNKRNGKTGELTEEQAAIWPDLFEIVDEAGSAPVVEDPGVTKGSPARTDKKD